MVDNPPLYEDNKRDPQKDLAGPVGANLRTSDDFVNNPIVQIIQSHKITITLCISLVILVVF
jgi:hypothetical protein